MCMNTCLCVYACAYTYTCVQMHMEARGLGIFLYYSFLYTEAGSWKEPRICWLATLASQFALGNPVS